MREKKTLKCSIQFFKPSCGCRDIIVSYVPFLNCDYMNAISNKLQKDSAVSPAVAVILVMIIVVILAVILIVTGGPPEYVSQAPNVQLESRVYSEESLNTVYLISVYGEKLDLTRVSVSIYDGAGNKVAAYENPSAANSVGLYLDEGEVLDLRKGTNSPAVPGLPAGSSANVVVRYDDKHILYDETVRVE